MITVAAIKAALVDILETVPGVGAVNGYGWFPDLIGSTVAIVIPPLRTESLYGYKQARGPGDIDFQAHRFYCEVWVRDTGDPQALDSLMSGINSDAVSTLMTYKEFAVSGATARLGWWDGDRWDYAIGFEVEDGWRRLVNDGPQFLVAALVIPVSVNG